MWKLIGLFSLLLFLSFAQEIRKEFELNVEFIGREVEEKPKLLPPKRLEPKKVQELNLIGSLLEPPRFMEFERVKPVEKSAGISCGEPKDALSYRLGVDYYLRGDYQLAKAELEKVLVYNSPFKPMAEYVLGIIAYSEKDEDRAYRLFKSSCEFNHMYQKPACSAYYALSLRLRGNVPENQDPLWSAVRSIKEGKIKAPDCKDAVFVQYCQYVEDFVEGRENPIYKDSTLMAKAVGLYIKGNTKLAKELLKKQAEPLKPYRDIALYYLALAELKEGNIKESLRYASLLQSINQSLAKNLYSLLATQDLLLSRYVYSLTGDAHFLENAGILAYNSGDYNLALHYFERSGNTLYAVYSAVMEGNYEKVIELLRDKRLDKEGYMWLLEALYWTGKDMKAYLSQVASSYPDLYREYSGWEKFRQGDWLSALGFFDEPYYKALCLYNLKRYREVVDVLRGRNDERSRLLKARSSLMLGDTKLARSFLTDKSDEERYLLGMSYFLEGNYQRAIEFFKNVSDGSKIKDKALLKLGDAYYNTGNMKLAKQAYEEVLRKYPDSPSARLATLALLQMGEKVLSQEEMEKLIRSVLAKEDKPELRYQLALIELRKGDKETARKELLKLVGTPLESKAVLKLAQIEDELPKKMVLLYKVYKEGEPEDRKVAREELIRIYSQVGDTKSIADLFAEGDSQDKVKAIGMYLSVGDILSAQNLAKALISEGFRNEEFENYLLTLYTQTKDIGYLEYAKKSPNLSIRSRATYLSGLYHMERGEYTKALEDFVDISLNYKGQEDYNKAVLKGAEVLIKLEAKKDASCFLERFDITRSTPEELSLYNRFKKELPKCGGK